MLDQWSPHALREGYENHVKDVLHLFAGQVQQVYYRVY